MVNARQTWYLEKYDKLSNQQYEFRKQEHYRPICQNHNRYTSSFSFKQKEQTLAVFFDMKKTVNN